MPGRTNQEQAVDDLITQAIRELDETTQERGAPEATKKMLRESVTYLARAYTMLVADTKGQQRYTNSVFTTLEYLAVSIQRCREALERHVKEEECEHTFQRAIHRAIDAQIAVYQTVETPRISNVASI